MARDLGHGRRITLSEYREGIASLYRDAAAMPTREQDATLRRAELDLAIDHRLGIEFPGDRRDALWHAAQALERHRGRAGLAALAVGPLLGSRGRLSRELARRAVREYASVLTEDELDAFFGAGEARDPQLPPRR